MVAMGPCERHRQVLAILGVSEKDSLLQCAAHLCSGLPLEKTEDGESTLGVTRRVRWDVHTEFGGMDIKCICISNIIVFVYSYMLSIYHACICTA